MADLCLKEETHLNSFPLGWSKALLNDSGRGPNTLSDLQEEPLKRFLANVGTTNFFKIESRKNTLFATYEARICCPDRWLFSATISKVERMASNVPEIAGLPWNCISRFSSKLSAICKSSSEAKESNKAGRSIESNLVWEELAISTVVLSNAAWSSVACLNELASNKALRSLSTIRV